MTTTARQMTSQIATDSLLIADLVILGIYEDEFETCAICGHPAAELRIRLDEDHNEVEACESCIDLYCLGYVAD
jgi:hypothetical protein